MANTTLPTDRHRFLAGMTSMFESIVSAVQYAKISSVGRGVPLLALTLPLLYPLGALAAPDEAAGVLELEQAFDGGAAFGLPADRARVLHDSESLKLSCWNDDTHFVLQAVVRADKNPKLGETADGRVVGDNASLVVDADADGKLTPFKDRRYFLNPWPKRPGLHFAFWYGRGRSSKLSEDSRGKGSIRYLPRADGTRVRVDTYVLPLKELQLEPGKKLRVGYMASSAEPQLLVNSIGYKSDKPSYNSSSLPFDLFHEVSIEASQSELDISLTPRGRDDEPMVAEKNIKPLPEVGAVPPKLAADGWMNCDEPPTLEGLKGKVVLLDFWATWCGPCVAGMPQLNELHREHKDEGLVVISYTDQSLRGVEGFLKEREIEFIAGAGGDLAAEYGVTALPHTFVIGRDGKLVWHGAPTEKLIDKHVAEALAKEGVGVPVAAAAPSAAE